MGLRIVAGRECSVHSWTDGWYYQFADGDELGPYPSHEIACDAADGVDFAIISLTDGWYYQYDGREPIGPSASYDDALNAAKGVRDE
jgi:hypothetical protein